jgi:hypothetical protein
MYHEKKNKAKIMPKRHNAELLAVGFTGLFIAVSLLLLEVTGCLEILMSLF